MLGDKCCGHCCSQSLHPVMVANDDIGLDETGSYEYTIYINRDASIQLSAMPRDGLVNRLVQTTAYEVDSTKGSLLWFYDLVVKL